VRIHVEESLRAIGLQGVLALDVSGRPGTRLELWSLDPASGPVRLGAGTLPASGRALMVAPLPEGDPLRRMFLLLEER
jgi:hypothetical protein